MRKLCEYDVFDLPVTVTD